MGKSATRKVKLRIIQIKTDPVKRDKTKNAIGMLLKAAERFSLSMGRAFVHTLRVSSVAAPVALASISRGWDWGRGRR